MIDLDITYLNDLKTILQYKDMRSVRSYLKRMGVPVFANKSKRPYCLKLQFERAVLEDKIKNLKQKYGNDWLKVMEVEMQVYSNHKVILEGFQNTRAVPQKESHSYGPLAMKFLHDLQSM